MTRRKINPSARPWSRIREEVLKRDGYRCRQCGKAGRFEIHHVVHLSAGGSNEPGNLLTLCRDCHIAAHQPKVDTGWDKLVKELTDAPAHS